MNKDIFSVMQTRRSVRSFTNTPITRDELLLLVEYGALAPSPANEQDYRFIITDDKKKMMALPNLCHEQDWISQAGGAIVVCAQPHRLQEWFGEKAKQLASQSSAAAIQNILLAAHALDLGACWVSGFEQGPIRELFDIPDNVEVEGIIPVGHPYSKPQSKSSKELHLLAFFESWGNDKKDLALLNKDFSLKIEEKITQAKEATKGVQQSSKKFIDKVKNFVFKQDEEKK